MSPRFYVRASQDELRFAAAHFVTLGDGTCEPLHGHNYRVQAEVHGPLDDNQWVIDFHQLTALLRAVLAELDHRVLLPTGHPTIHVTAGDRDVEVRFEERRWVFPRAECVLLPLANTTAERLAEHIARRLLAELDRLGRRPAAIRIEVEESPGLTAACEV